MKKKEKVAKNTDVLLNLESKVENFKRQSNFAVEVFQSCVDDLDKINKEIEDSLEEVASNISRLHMVENSLATMRGQNAEMRNKIASFLPAN